jgi:hypothetical protein
MAVKSRARNKVFNEQQEDELQIEVDPATGIQKKNVARDDFGWEVPVETVPIPSKGIVYPQGTALGQLETIDIRAMTAREEDILTSQALIRKGTVISTLLQSVVLNEGIDVNDLLMGDRNALMIATRITGYGSDYSVNVKCMSCNTKQDYTFNLGDLPIKRLNIDPVSHGQNLFEFELPVTKKKVLFKFLTGTEEETLSELSKRRKALFPDIEVTSLVTSRLESMIVSIDKISDRGKISAFVRDMPAYDSRVLRGYITNNEPGIEMKSVMCCRECGQTSEIQIPIGLSFFWPDL